ncbi:uracil-DNA glycosylase [Dentipellis sp. KUC8613]|nr:uracil-DNA glycosylase [Dentipellis sp. KUC8613]
MDAERRVVYLEDLEPPKAKPVGAEKEPADASPSASQESSASTKAKPAVTAVKRQRTLMDMFSSSPASAEPSSKKQKLVKSGSSSSALAVSGKSVAGSSASTTTLGLQPLNAIPFSMSAYQDSLTEDQRRLLKLECETMGKSWLKLLKDEIRKPYFISLKEFLWKEGVQGPDDSAKNLKVYPAPKNIYSWSNYTPLGKVKVVIVGQDPYHGAGQAHGLCFSVPPNVAVPPSLHNIFKEIRAEYPDFVPPKHGTLTAWAENGVLMLNTCLTVRAGDAGSHSQRGWEQFTDKVVDVVDRYGGANLPTTDPSDKAGHGRGVVFLAWGAWAAKRVAKLDKKKHLILTSAHPSPFSANKGFLGNGHFKKANDWLEARYGPDGRVDWCRLGPVI